MLVPAATPLCRAYLRCGRSDDGGASELFSSAMMRWSCATVLEWCIRAALASGDGFFIQFITLGSLQLLFYFLLCLFSFSLSLFFSYLRFDTAVPSFLLIPLVLLLLLLLSYAFASSRKYPENKQQSTPQRLVPSTINKPRPPRCKTQSENQNQHQHRHAPLPPLQSGHRPVHQ